MVRVTATLDCAICFNDIVSKEKGDRDWVILVGCGHIFHSGCIRQWCNTFVGESRTKRQNTCPLCKATIIHPGNNKSQSRFRRIIFGGDGGVVEKEGSSSSPARGELLQQSRKRRIVEDDDEEEDAEGACATESESDEENRRPAQRVLRHHEAINNNNEGDENPLTVELRALLETKHARISELEAELESRSELIEAYIEKLESSKEETDALEGRMVVLNTEKKKEQDRSTKLREEKKGLTKTLQGEMEKVTKYKEQVGRLSVEIGTVKESLDALKKKHDELQNNYNQLSATHEAYNNTHDKQKLHIHRLLETKAVYEEKNARKRIKISELEKELEELRGGRAEVKIDRKGKGRAVNQDEDLDLQDDSGNFHSEDTSMAGTSHGTSAASAKNSTRPKRVYSLVDDGEESLQIEGQSLAIEDELGEETEDFTDLDAGFTNQARKTTSYSSSSASVTARSTKGSTAVLASKTISRFFTANNASSDSINAMKDGKKAIAAKGSDKWTDMAIGGKSKGAIGAKKKVKIGF